MAEGEHFCGWGESNPSGCCFGLPCIMHKLFDFISHLFINSCLKAQNVLFLGHTIHMNIIVLSKKSLLKVDLFDG